LDSALLLFCTMTTGFGAISNLLSDVMTWAARTLPFWLALLICVAPVSAVAQDNDLEPGDAILGTWLSGAEGKELARVLIYKDDGRDKGQDGGLDSRRVNRKYFGKIVWLEYPEFRDDDEQGMAGMTKVDRENRDPKLRGHPILGLVILKNFDFEPDRKWPWTGGTVYDPENGKTYRGRMRLEKDGGLRMRGYVGIPLFGRSTWWTRSLP